MTKSSFVLIIALILGASTPSTSDLIDEANAQYLELRDIVEGKIAAASTQFSVLRSDVSTNGQTVYTQGIINIAMIHDQTIAIVNQIKDAAESEGNDITRCTERPEETISSLPNQANLELQRCINGMVDGASNLVSTAVSRVNGLISRVHDFRFRISSCNGNFLCVSPILQDIELAKIQIPQEVDTEILETTGWLGDIKVTIQACSDNTVSHYSTMMSVELGVVAQCLG